LSLFWLSFCDPDKPSGQRFLGVAIVEGDDLRDAVQNAWELKINPGGEVMSAEVTEEYYGQFRNRLLTKEEALVVRFGGKQ
jgi:hypothetical protein